ncbi:hypothetical protein PtA15_4A547 [Puccinia triticina]|uniref:Uncharacterized protein n=1 Tax=Puccinia triticina TaxID=208348 RepID=A0ABY7CFU6_9BASI|nr:uncharacterized protein PtA15_4A547 [Puccinia triticina]WAQ84096.1 hypothetical protein PtA15_4A547 [Puccinia triticina]
MSPAGVAGRGADGGAQDGVRQVAHLCDSFEGADVGPRQEVVELAKRAGVRAHDARDGGPEVRPGRRPPPLGGLPREHLLHPDPDDPGIVGADPG